jgi:hypothetical protein
VRLSFSQVSISCLAFAISDARFCFSSSDFVLIFVFSPLLTFSKDAFYIGQDFL